MFSSSSNVCELLKVKLLRNLVECLAAVKEEREGGVEDGYKRVQFLLHFREKIPFFFNACFFNIHMCYKDVFYWHQ